MDLEEIEKSIKATLYTRLSSPFTGAFIFAWLVYNWIFWSTLLFNSAGVENRVEYLSELYMSDVFFFGWEIGTRWFWIGIISPFLSALGIIYLLPFLTKPIYEYHLMRNKEKLDIKRKIDDTKLLSQEESDKMWLLINKTKQELKDVVNSHQNEVEGIQRAWDKRYKDKEKELTAEIENLKEDRKRLSTKKEVNISGEEVDKETFSSFEVTRGVREFFDSVGSKIDDAKTETFKMVVEWANEEDKQIDVPTEVSKVVEKLSDQILKGLSQLKVSDELSKIDVEKTFVALLGKLDNELYRFLGHNNHSKSQWSSDQIREKIESIFKELYSFASSTKFKGL